MNAEHFDPVTYVHWLHWELRRLKGSADEFQRMFEDVAARATDRFVRVRPYGSIGDRKCDGLYWDDGTVYQVYSPDDMKQADTCRKIEEDLSGAVAHWGDHLTRWVFVYNVRRGLPPDVPRLLQERQSDYPDLAIEPMSNDDLWKIAQALPAQDRVEILGAPPGYEDLFSLSATLPNEIAGRLTRGRFLLVQDILSPINVEDVIQALAPARPFAPPLFIRPPAVHQSWSLAAEYQKALIDDALARSREQLPRFAAFSLSPIPLAIHLGYVLSDRVEVEPFQYDRDRRTWCWDSDARPDARLLIDGVPAALTSDSTEAVIRVSLSDRIHRNETTAVVGQHTIEIDIAVHEPDVKWLVSPSQLSSFGSTFRSILAKLREFAPNLQRLHLFCAAPTGACIVMGQALNPRMNPLVVLYEYDRRRDPRYRRVLALQ